jgi:zinc protease
VGHPTCSPFAACLKRLFTLVITIGLAGVSSCGSRFGPEGASITMRRPTLSTATPAILSASATLGRLGIRKWRFANGLELITAPDRSATSVSYVTTFRVGSRDEDASRQETGLAHLFEHLMFTQTRGGAPGAFDRAIESIGGTTNASTDHDLTSYVDELPAAALGRIIALEADRMTNLDLLDRQVASERDVVLEERLSVVDDSVDGTLDELMYGQAFQHHPYRWPVIGRKEDIQSITKKKATAFYRRHYAPDRAVISVAGQFDEAFVVAEVQAAYGSLAPSPDRDTSAVAVTPERAPGAEIVKRIEQPVPADRFVAGYPAPGLGDADRVAYEILAEILAGGPSSRLFRQLVVERSSASSVQAQVAPTRDPGLFAVWVQMIKGHDSDEADGVLSKEIARLVAEPVPATELVAAKNRLETQFWRELGSSRARAEALGDFDVTTGDFRILVARSSQYAKITAADVQNVARSYLASPARSVVIARPTSLPPAP